MLLNVILAVGTLIAAAAALMAWLDSRRDRRDNTVEDQVKHGVAPLSTKIDLLAQRFDDYTANAGESTEAAIARGLRPLSDEIVELRTKVAVFWKDVALGTASIIHQPDPQRAHIDALIDALTEGTITPAQQDELAGYLRTIRDWEPGQDAGFPVVQGEQTAAVLLLHTMHMLPEYPEGGSAHA